MTTDHFPQQPYTCFQRVIISTDPPVSAHPDSLCCKSSSTDHDEQP